MRKWNDSRLEKKKKTKDMFSVRITIFFLKFSSWMSDVSFEVTVTNLAEYFPNFLRYSKLRKLLAPKWGEHNWDFKIELL